MTRQWANLAPAEYRRQSRPLVALEHRLSLSEDVADPERTQILRSLRPQKLIGESRPLHNWENALMSERALSRTRKANVRAYYERQNDLIRRFQGVDALLDSGMHLSLIEEYGDDLFVDNPRTRGSLPMIIHNHRAAAADTLDADPEANGDRQTPPQSTSMPVSVSPRLVHFWININLLANAILLIGKFVVWYLTDSLSIGASLVDSVLDMLSTLIIFTSARLADRRDWKTRHLYPVGRHRLEPIGVLVFSVIMITSFLSIANDSFTALWAGSGRVVEVGAPSVAIMVLTIAIKVVLWALCRRVPSSSIQALAQDAETDVTFNFFSIVFPVTGHLLSWWRLDPFGALILSFYVVWSWGDTAMEHIDNLTGAAASPEDRQELLYLCLRFSERLIYVTALNVYHAGDRLMCEVDVVLDNALSMRDCHDLAEALQYALETLPIVERAFVHLEYRRDNFSGHLH